MGSRLFQEAQKAVMTAKVTTEEQTVEKAKNALSSAYTHSNLAEKRQLRQLQNELNDL
ncbi:DUF3813 domain-containing protein [Anoxybacillus rupiensis]|uniref:DUF3813 domain-containing protein n=1 Tax=Anoxybacteroides rupiense TaxID=311460 RepID=A0ABD5IVN8_9BACL|nr:MULTISPECIES: DUF3813 domain-containing protein [Anoxybacillus]KXG10142.1 hypothetical protein AT864_01703 [Anoxybacillus sp. P3H1B]MBB3907526.1 hypothetical protein [Anoxybacillus rupiensis]MDE8565225.1 DUF3813 domain-containing protein [Anoxybacillus rupiensis]MED5051850.1 DUF3813 domain-containing protein [Anoxybacillus rupiensis]QHC03226.1 DUF3813 family protein [Anoxybacillus sp. PDR2]